MSGGHSRAYQSEPRTQKFDYGHGRTERLQKGRVYPALSSFFGFFSTPALGFLRGIAEHLTNLAAQLLVVLGRGARPFRDGLLLRAHAASAK